MHRRKNERPGVDRPGDAKPQLIRIVHLTIGFRRRLK
jgi:hypothetical protein